MKHKYAASLVNFLLEQSKQQNDFLLQQKEFFSDEDFDEAKKIIAKTMMSIYFDGLHPLLKEHPELKPPGLHI